MYQKYLKDVYLEKYQTIWSITNQNISMDLEKVRAHKMVFCACLTNRNAQWIMESYPKRLIVFLIFFSIWVFFHEHSRITGLQGKGEGISLTPHYHFHLLHRHLDISRAITAESSPLHIGTSRTRTGKLWFPGLWFMASALLH